MIFYDEKLPEVLKVQAYGVDHQDEALIHEWLKTWVKIPCEVRFLAEPDGDPDGMITRHHEPNTDVFAYGRPDLWGWWINTEAPSQHQSDQHKFPQRKYGMVLRYPAVKAEWHAHERKLRGLSE